MADRRNIDRALAALHSFMADESGMWPDDERTIESAIAVLAKYRSAADKRRTY